MQLHNVKRNKSNRKSRQVGRGGAKGKTSGRGTKGQNARSGRKKRPEMRDFIKRIPKLRGRGKNFLKSIKQDNHPINLSAISQKFLKGEVVSKATLMEKGLINRGEVAKVLAAGELDKELTFKGLELSKSAIEKITKAGGRIE